MRGSKRTDDQIYGTQLVVSLVALLVGVVALIVGTKDEWGWIVLASAFLVAGGARGLQLAGIHRLLRHGRSVFRGRSGDGSP